MDRGGQGSGGGAVSLARSDEERSSARVLMPGGVLRRSAGSLVGRFLDGLESRGRIAKGYFGVVGLSTTHGLMDLAVEEADTKRSMSAACDEVYGLFDSSKIEGFGLHSFAPAARSPVCTPTTVPRRSSSRTGGSAASRSRYRPSSREEPRC